MVPRWDVFTLRMVADYLHLSERTVLRAVQKGEIPFARKIGGQWRVPSSTLYMWAAGTWPAQVDHQHEEVPQ